MKRTFSTLAVAGLTLGLAAAGLSFGTSMPATAQQIEEIELCTGSAGRKNYPDPIVVRFDSGSADIKEEFQSRMDEAAKTIKGEQPLMVCLIGSADKQGSVGDQLAIANKRAHAVGNKLVEMGVDPAVLKVVKNTRASDQKILSKIIGEDRPAERRVTILLMK